MCAQLKTLHTVVSRMVPMCVSYYDDESVVLCAFLILVVVGSYYYAPTQYPMCGSYEILMALDW